jgi:vacuolar protein sorting-associated protein VTA1
MQQSPSGSSKEYLGPSSIYAPHSKPISPPTVVYPAPPSGFTPPNLPPSTSPPRSYIYAPPASSQASPPHASARYPPPPPPLPPQAEVELTPELIVKVQKHCRFAISALDYEDAEQAKKDLRAALALLGG